MGDVIGTCGHKLEWKGGGDGFGNSFYIKEYSAECDGSGRWGKGVAYICVCDECAKWYRRKSRSFKNQEEAMAWLEKGDDSDRGNR